MSLGTEFEVVLAAAQSGAEWAVDVLFREFHPALLRYLRAQEPGVAEDLASETWMAVAPGLARFTGSEVAFRAWMFTIARRRLIDHRRRVARRRTQPVPVEDMAGWAAADDPAESGVAAASAQEMIDRLVAVLPAEQAEVVLLRVVAGLGVAEVAQLMGKRPGAVRMLQHRALRRLGKEFSEETVTR